MPGYEGMPWYEGMPGYEGMSGYEGINLDITRVIHGARVLVAGYRGTRMLEPGYESISVGY